MKPRIALGVLFSRSGSYTLLGDASRTGALQAVTAINGDAGRRFAFDLVERDPAGRTESYATLCDEIFRETSARHVVGCITSWSRKEVIPTLEKRGGLLWYPAPYEGFEANDHVVYMNAAPNQHLVPLLAHVAARHGRGAFLVGSNYIWGWEMNRIARDLVADAGGAVKGERCLPLGDTDVSRIIEEIRESRPDFILNNLIGPSSYAFYEAYAALGAEDARFGADRRPVLSCNLTECELGAVSPFGEGHLSCGPFFRDGGAEGPQSGYEAAAHAAVTVLADAIESAGTDDPATVRRVLGASTFQTALGPVRIDPRTQHASLPVRIAKIRGDRFEVVETVADMMEPDPYLSHHDPATLARPALRLVR